MENKRILIYEDLELLNNKLDDLNKFTPAFNALKEAYEALELGELTNDIYKELISAQEGAGKVMDSFFTELDSALKAAGFNKESLRKVHVEHAEAEFKNFLEALKALKAVNPDPHSHRRFEGLSIENTSYIDGVFQVSAMDQEDIMEDHCRIYLADDLEIKLHTKLKNVRDAINDFNSYLTGLTEGRELNMVDSLHFHTITGLSSLHQFLDGDGKKEIIPYSIKWVSEMISRAKVLDNPTTLANSK